MSNYDYIPVSGESWLRANRVVVENPLSGPKIARFIEERVYHIEDKTLVDPAGVLEVVLNTQEDFEELVQVIDPETGAPTEMVVSMAQIYAILYSAYIQKVKERDFIPLPDEGEEPAEGEEGDPEVEEPGEEEAPEEGEE